MKKEFIINCKLENIGSYVELKNSLLNDDIKKEDVIENFIKSYDLAMPLKTGDDYFVYIRIKDIMHKYSKNVWNYYFETLVEDYNNEERLKIMFNMNRWGIFGTDALQLVKEFEPSDLKNNKSNYLLIKEFNGNDITKAENILQQYHDYIFICKNNDIIYRGLQMTSKLKTY